MKLSIIVPVFNEQATIGSVLDQLGSLSFEKEIIIIDDGSTDESRTVIQGHTLELIAEHLPTNGGKGAAVRRGLELATGEIIVVQDADLELSPAIIEQLAMPIRAGDADAVFGSRFLAPSPNVPLARRIANHVLTAITNLLYRTRLSDMETAHKAVRKDVLDRLDLESERFEIEVEVTAKLARSGARIHEIPSPYRPRRRDEGKKIGWRDGVVALRTLVKYRRWSHRPTGEIQPPATANERSFSGAGRRRGP